VPRLPKAHAGAAAVFVEEFDAGGIERAPELFARFI